MSDVNPQASPAVTFQNIKEVLDSRCSFYEAKSEELRNLIDREGVTVENISQRRSNILQELALDISHDLSMVSKTRLGCVGSPYYEKLLSDFNYFLKDLLGSYRLFVDSERWRPLNG
jgi:hypothetical protein